MTSTGLNLLKMKLIIKARGFWFTAGGEKGSFGYYPHLKQQIGAQFYPVYPDTQICGDLKMAANWLSVCDPATYPKELVRWLFGVAEDDETNTKKKATQRISLIAATDLELTKDSRYHWKPDRFVVRTRIQIDDIKRTNNDKMLASFEYAYLEGCTLESWLYVGYCKTVDEIEKAKNLLTECANLLSGFGAMRSRGFGRGEISFPENHIKVTKFVPEQGNPALCPGIYHYGINARTHFRNKIINPARTQLLVSRMQVNPRQLQGWFAQVHQQIYGIWPSPAQMALITFTTFYPSPLEAEVLTATFPPPFTTIKGEDDTICDRFGYKPVSETDHDDLCGKKQKWKPLAADIFLTYENPPRLVHVGTGKRFRNSIGPHLATLTEGGLFTQEFIPNKTRFVGKVTINASSDVEFGNRAGWILNNVWPKINGTLFLPMNTPYSAKSANATEQLPDNPAWILTEPIDFTLDRLKWAEQYRLDVTKSYNTALEVKRPRRNRIVFKPGSIMNHDCEHHAQIWKAAGKMILEGKKEEDNSPVDALVSPSSEPLPSTISDELKEKIKRMNRSQIGNLRDFREMRIEMIPARIGPLLDKYDRWKNKYIQAHLVPKEVLEKIKSFAEDNQQTNLNRYIDDVMLIHAMHVWKRKHGEKERYQEELQKRNQRRPHESA
jgi:hypothetical protein